MSRLSWRLHPFKNLSELLRSIFCAKWCLTLAAVWLLCRAMISIYRYDDCFCRAVFFFLITDGNSGTKKPFHQLYLYSTHKYDFCAQLKLVFWQGCAFLVKCRLITVGFLAQENSIAPWVIRIARAWFLSRLKALKPASNRLKNHIYVMIVGKIDEFFSSPNSRQ